MLAIIGGTGIYGLEAIEQLGETFVETPFGQPSGPVVRGRWGKQEVLFLARHGQGHRLLPHEINYRANIFALKQAGATHVIGVSAVGSLAESIAPGDLVLPTQYFDWTRGKRAGSFFGDGIAAHVSTAQPVSANLVRWLGDSARRQKASCHQNVTYACVEGPRLGTRAESHFLRLAGCQVVGMTNVPEAFLAREAQLCYASLGVVTDYDCWMEDPTHHVRATEIFALYKQSLAHAIAVLGECVQQPLPDAETDIRSALSVAILTPESNCPAAARDWMAVLRR
jgi:5'-methylthioadenosine phosphorylase